MGGGKHGAGAILVNGCPACVALLRDGRLAAAAVVTHLGMLSFASSGRRDGTVADPSTGSCQHPWFAHKSSGSRTASSECCAQYT